MKNIESVRTQTPNGQHAFCMRARSVSKRSRLQLRCGGLAVGMISVGLLMIGCQFERDSQDTSAPVAAANDDAVQLEPFTQDVPASTSTVRMIPMAAGSVTLQTADGSQQVDVEPFYIAQMEIPWEIFDVFVFARDAENPDDPDPGVDAYTRPSRPYVPPDRGYGHDGYAAISITARSAKEFCNWLSEKTGRRYRLPTEAEWQLACERSGITEATADDYSWFAANSDGTPHPVGSKKADQSGLYDLWGNVREWVIGHDGTPIAAGGSFLDELDEVGCNARHAFHRDWQMTDPQIPKSPWWLSDGEFMGFRIVCEPQPSAD